MVGAIIILIFAGEETEAHCEGITRSHSKRQCQNMNTALLVMMSVFLLLCISVVRNEIEG